MADYTIKIDQERMYNEVTVDQFIALMENNLIAIVEVLSICLWDKASNAYYPPEKARELVGKLKIKKLMELAGVVRENIEDSAIPKEKETESG